MRYANKWRSRLLGLAFSLFVFCGLGHAATFQNIAIKVSIAGTKSVLVIGATTYNFGALNVAVSSVSASSFTVQNNSPVFIETYTVTGANAISTTGGTDWTIAASTGTSITMPGWRNTARM